MRIPLKPLAAAIAACAAAFATADTLYKLIDKNGKITYSEEAPKNFDGQVIRLDIDRNANTAVLPKPTPVTETAARKRDAAEKKDQHVDDLKTRLEDAKKALQNAKDNPGPGDIDRVGTKSGFTRGVPTEEYEKKLATLQEDVKKAEEELKRAGGSP
ncbi:MAG TPA: DUF4124 domain-containing protein [Usitatibacter sp.]|jgi:polyhydroxyalkanoate synthesis regulator phasin|nr:DUF4124 domain-containing protein [Usitatibacter sp.]